MKSVRITNSAIDVAEVIMSVQDSSAGGTVVFIGTIRNSSEGRRVEELEYEVYVKMAEKRMAQLAAEVKKRWPVKKIIMVHRRGRLKVGEISVVVAVSSEHRAEAFKASKFAIDTIKRAVPIWKKERGKKGSRWIRGEPISR
jgi:molybdopterin synthase catalytic subunit